jgi:hypothetical protein
LCVLTFWVHARLLRLENSLNCVVSVATLLTEVTLVVNSEVRQPVHA